MDTPVDRSIDLRQLRYFLVLADELNFRRAAERLHLTQPPLSRQIAALEAALGVVLFDRSGPATRLTAAGQVARQELLQAVTVVEAALRRVSAAASGPRDKLRLGLPWWVDMSGFGRVDQALRQATGVPLIEPELANGLELLAMLHRQQLDAALVPMPQDLQGLAHSVVARLPHVALIPASSPLARKRALRLRDLETLPAFLRAHKRAHPAQWQHFQRLYDAAGFKPAREVHAPGTTATIAQIAAGRGCTVMPAAFARQKYPGVVARRLLDDVHVEVALVQADHLEPVLAQALRAQATLLEAVLR